MDCSCREPLSSVPVLGGFQLPVTLAPEGSNISGLHRHPHTGTHVHIHINIITNNKKNSNGLSKLI